MPKRSNEAMVTSTHHPAIQKIVSKGDANRSVINIGNEQGLNVHYDRFDYRVQVDGTSPAFNKVVRFKVPPSFADFLTGFRVLLTLAGPIVDGAGTSVNEAYPEGVASLFSRIQYKQGGNVFYQQEGDLETHMHEFDSSKGKYDRNEVIQGFGAIASRDAQLGAGYKYIIEMKLDPFSSGGGNFPLRSCNAPIYIEFQMMPPVVDTQPAATGTITGPDIMDFELDMHCLNVPPNLFRAVDQMVSTGNGVEQVVLEAQSQSNVLAAGSTSYQVQLDQFPGVCHGIVFVLRPSSALNTPNQYRPTDYMRTLANWNLIHNNVPVLNDHGQDTDWHLNEYQHDKLGNELNGEHVHVHLFGSAPELQGMFKGGFSPGHFVFNPHDDYQLSLTLNVAPVTPSSLHIWGLNYIIVRVKQGRVQRVTK